MDIPIDIPPGLNSDSTTYSAAPAWADGSGVRFRLGRPQTCGGWESLITSLVTGVCRSVLAWTDNNSATLNIAFGTHSNLQLWQGGAFYDITPFGPVTALSANPLSVTHGSAAMTVAHVGHGLASGAQVAIANAANATSTATGGGSAVAAAVPASGGGAAVVATPQQLLPAGARDGTGTSATAPGRTASAAGGSPRPRTISRAPGRWRPGARSCWRARATAGFTSGRT